MSDAVPMKHLQSSDSQKEAAVPDAEHSRCFALEVLKSHDKSNMNIIHAVHHPGVRDPEALLLVSMKR